MGQTLRPVVALCHGWLRNNDNALTPLGVAGLFVSGAASGVSNG